MRANVLTKGTLPPVGHPLSEGEERDRTYRTDMTNRTMKAIRIMIVLVGMLLAGCQERNEKVECREMVGRGVAAQPFVREDGYGWEAKPELTEEDSVGLAMRRTRRLLIDDGPLYY